MSGLPLDPASILQFRKNMRKKSSFEEVDRGGKGKTPRSPPDLGVAGPRWHVLTDMYDEEKREMVDIVEKYRTAVAAQEALDSEKRDAERNKGKTYTYTAPVVVPKKKEKKKKTPTRSALPSLTKK